MKQKMLLNRFLDYAFYIAGCSIYAIAVAMFVEPARLSPGGITGIATVFHFLFDIPTGITVLLLNLPLIIIAFLKLGKKFVINTGIATICLSVTLTLAENFIKPHPVDTVLSALFGGIMMGAGLSLVFLRSATTGGFDIIAKLINRKKPYFSIGKLYLLMDVAVILLTAVCYGNFESALYSALSIYVASKTMDYILYGSDGGKLLLSVTKNPQAVAKQIFQKIGHGVTVLDAIGGYTNNPTNVLLCAVRRHEAARVLQAIKSEDPNAFTIITDIGEIAGYGFYKREV